MLEIEEYDARHSESLLKLILTIQNQEFGIDITAADQPDLQDVQQFYLAGGGNFWLAHLGSNLVGSIALIKLNETQYVLRKMFVAAGYRGSQHGVAQCLLQTAERWAKSRAGQTVYLGTTDKFLAAHRFYRKHGYQEIEQDSLPLDFPLMAVDSLFFCKQLQA